MSNRIMFSHPYLSIELLIQQVPDSLRTVPAADCTVKVLRTGYSIGLPHSRRMEGALV
jgi:hypothetical protein